MKSLKGKKVLVTGGSGFIASHLSRRLVQEGAHVFVLTRYNSIIDNVRLTDIWDEIVPVEADLRNLDALEKIRSLTPEIVYHFAAYNHVGDSFSNVSEAIDVNCKGTVNLLDAYEDYKKFIYISSSEIYGFQNAVPFAEDAAPFPISPYAVGKYAGELYARMKWKVFNKPIAVLRPFNAFGPFQSPRAVIAELIIKCLDGEDVVTTKGVQTRDFNYIENLVDGFIRAGTNDDAIGEIINIGSGVEISIVDLVKKIHLLTDSKSRLRIGELQYRPTEIWRMAADNKKASKIFGWSPRIDLEKGLIKTIEWYRKFNALFADATSTLYELCE
jgi:nucleoside-diphosphate-sugar epimerase